MPYDPLEPYDSSMDVRTLTAVKVAVTEHVSREFADRLELNSAFDHVGRRVGLRVSAYVLSEELPPATLTDQASFTVPRFATWYDHFAATYRGRWWARLLRLDRREVRFVDEPHTHTLTVAVRPRWTYPKADRVLPARDFGPTVLKVATTRESAFRPW